MEYFGWSFSIAFWLFVIYASHLEVLKRNTTVLRSKSEKLFELYESYAKENNKNNKHSPSYLSVDLERAQKTRKKYMDILNSDRKESIRFWFNLERKWFEYNNILHQSVGKPREDGKIGWEFGFMPSGIPKATSKNDKSKEDGVDYFIDIHSQTDEQLKKIEGYFNKVIQK